MHVTLYGGPHDGRTIDVGNDEHTVRLPVLERRADAGAPTLGEVAVYVRGDDRVWRHVTT